MAKENNFHKRPTHPGASKEATERPSADIPKKIGPYKIERLLDTGGMSYLYLGIHPETNQPLAIKTLSPKFLRNPEVVQRFLREAEIIALTDHPNIIKLHGQGEWEGGLYIAMEFIQGCSLRDFLLTNPISLKHALEIILDVAYALCHLHTHGVIHRDLKPENILITNEGQVKVIDFGIAQLIADEKERPDQGTQNRLIGTPIYMSPEQRDIPDSVSFPSDIYSLGIIAYELILGKFSHGQIHLSMMPRGMHLILAKALQPKPADRYQDAVDFITDVSSYMNSPSLQKEKRARDAISELSESLRHTQQLLLPTLSPSWPKIDIGITTYKSTRITGTFYDFIQTGNDAYALLMATCANKSAEEILYASTLRGMIRALTPLTTHPEEFVMVLNEVLLQDPMKQIFGLAYLLLLPKENEYRYLSCGYGSMWSVSKDKQKTTSLANVNPLVGEKHHAEFHEITGPWLQDHFLILHTLPYSSEELFQQALSDNIELPPQGKTENIMRKITASVPAHLQADESRSIICIHRQ